MNAANPSALSGDFNDNWTLSAGDASDGVVSTTQPFYWKVTSSSGGQTWRQTHSGSSITLIACFKFITAPTNGETIMLIDNGTHKV